MSDAAPLPPESKPLVLCENLVKIFKVANLEVVALQGLDLTVRQGEMLGIVGNSGSGKSTLMYILGGLDRPSAGKVVVDGKDLLKLSGSDLIDYQRTKIGFIWQQASRNLVPYLTAQENVELPMTLSWSYQKKAQREWAAELLQAVGLYERRFHRLAQLSGGEQQRVAIAVALANHPVLLLGDEPTGEVDTATAHMIVEIFRNLNRQMGLTTIIVTHDPRLAGQLDRVIAIRDGKISTETVRQVNRPRLDFTGLDHPAVELGAPDGGASASPAPAPGTPEAEAPAAAERDHITYQEYVVLDSSGRLQIPRDWLEQLGIEKRAQLALDDGCIRIQPVTGEAKAGGPRKLTLEEQLELLFSEEAPAPKKSFFSRFRRPS